VRVEHRLDLDGRNLDPADLHDVVAAPVEVEAVLHAHPAVAAVAVVGVPDADGLVQPWAFVIPTPDHEPTAGLAASLQAWARDRLPRYAYPRRVAFVAELPRTATGKLQRFRLLEEVRPPAGPR
jgi:benzoate-CoA ligase